MIQEDYVSFEVAKLLKEKGFKEECLRFYMPNECSRWKYEHYHDFDIRARIECPTLQMAIKWLRKEYEISIEISALNLYHWVYTIYRLLEDKVEEVYNNGTYTSYEDATNDALKYCLENLI